MYGTFDCRTTKNNVLLHCGFTFEEVPKSDQILAYFFYNCDVILLTIEGHININVYYYNKKKNELFGLNMNSNKYSQGVATVNTVLL